ncbi:MAG: hypothetical protein GYA51_02390 [Candidatus Methanofastidiosa archaeon]|nr:hypothetical protein [Candidatus Methanofastidiosa archaeon]
MKNEQNFINCFKKGKIFFFAGSGICYDSNLPSAKLLLDYTSDVFLPKNYSNEFILNRLQPELFYESIIYLTKTYDCLKLWSILHDDVQNKYNLKCFPNIVHLIIVDYSFRKKIPIITTNFDVLFEKACDYLKIDYEVCLPTDKPSNIVDNKLKICKIHGSIQSGVKYTPESLFTTMTDITKINIEWIDFILNLMKSLHICFVGYSGKDLDIFPHINENSMNREEAFWINKFDNDNSNRASREINALRIEDYPKDFFVKNCGDLRIPSNILSYRIAKINSNKKKYVLEELKKELEEKVSFNQQSKILLHCICLKNISLYNNSYKKILKLVKKNESIKSRKKKLPIEHEIIMLLFCARLSHETSQNISIKKYAKEVVKKVKINKINNPNFRIQARCLISESLRMRIPNDHFFPHPQKFKLFLMVLFTIFHFCFTSVNNYFDLWIHGNRFNKLDVATQQEMIEHDIRLLISLQKVFIRKNSKKILIQIFCNLWHKIENVCISYGYAGGIANTLRYRWRISSTNEIRNKAKNIYSIITYSTGHEILLKDEAGKFVEERKFIQSEKRFIELINIANKSGNALNEIKGILGLSFVILARKQKIPSKWKKRFKELYPKIEGKMWKEYLEYVYRLF